MVAADAALAEELVTADQLRAELSVARGRPFVRNARKVVDLATPLCDSVLESLTRLCLHDGGVPAPKPQAWVSTPRGRYRVDLLWPDRRVVVEADGAKKYRTDDDALWKEKLRQEALERTGYCVVRVTWAEVHDQPAETVRRVMAALAGRAA